jgi:YVTN family beta-propeller protein
MTIFPMHSRKVLTLSLLAAITATVPPASAATPTRHSAFHIQNQWNLGGEGGWGHLLLDASAHRLYIPRANRVMVVDADTGKLTGEVEGFISTRGIALDDTGKFGYVTDLTDGTAGFVRIFDRSSLKLVASVPTGINPDALVFEPATKSVLALNTRSQTATVIDTATNQVAATIALPGRPTSAVVDGTGAIFVAIPALGNIVRIDAAAKKIAASWPLAPCTGPTGLAVDTAHRQLFTTCEDHKLVSVNIDTGHATAIGQVAPGTGDIDFDPRQNLLFVAGTDGTLSIFHRKSSIHYSPRQQIKTQPGARTMVANHQDPKVYLVASKYGQNTAAVSEELQFRPAPVPGTFAVIVIGR